MKKHPKVFIVILNYNGLEVLKKCLTSVFKIDYPSFEIVLMDNNSTDGSLEMAKTNFSKAIFIKNEENLGFAAGNNVGIKFALERTADFILLLNNDVEVEKNFLTQLIDNVAEKEKVGIASPVIFDGETREIWFSGGHIDWWRLKTVHEKNIQTEKFFNSDFITGCAMLIRAEVFQKIGLLDEDFFLYWEDADFSLRAGKAGFQNVVVPASWIYHFEKSRANQENKIYWLVVSGLIFFRKNANRLFKIWGWFYLILRRIKNYRDVKLKKDRISLVVQKAYRDFKNAQF
ncbi:glycosyltransferase family 2 protein [Patescibacteria group bacterium]|nr:glycosyltransferase family 2 protein [Patescibacteria group bacterium]